MKWTHLACLDFAVNKVRLQLFVHTYKLKNFFRPVALPESMQYWTMTTLREKVIKVDTKVVCHVRNIVFQMAEAALFLELFASILWRVGKLRLLVEQAVWRRHPRGRTQIGEYFRTSRKFRKN